MTKIGKEQKKKEKRKKENWKKEKRYKYRVG